MEEKHKRRKSFFPGLFKTDNPDAPSLDNTRRPSSPSSYTSGKNVDKPGRLTRFFQKKKPTDSGSSSAKMYSLASKGASMNDAGSMMSGGEIPASTSSFTEGKSKELFRKFKNKLKPSGSSTKSSFGSLLKRTKSMEKEDRRLSNDMELLGSRSSFPSSRLSIPLGSKIVLNYECNMNMDGKEFLGWLMIERDLLHVSSDAMQEADLNIEEDLKFVDIVEIKEQSRMLIIIKTQQHELLLSAFTCDFETAYYSIMVPFNRSRNFSSSLLDDSSSERSAGGSHIDSSACDCGVRHEGKKLLNIEANGIPPIGMYESLLKCPDMKYSIWNGVSDQIKMLAFEPNGHLKIGISPEMFGDLEVDREYEVQTKLMHISADHVLTATKMQSIIKSFDCRLSITLTSCFCRTSPDNPTIQANVFATAEWTEYGYVDQTIKEDIFPLLRNWLASAYERLVLALPEEDKFEEEYGMIEDCPTCSAVLKYAVIFSLLPPCSESLRQYRSTKLFKLKEAILSVLLVTLCTWLMARRLYDRMHVEKNFVPPDQRYDQYCSALNSKYTTVHERMKYEAEAIQRRLTKIFL